VTISILDDGVGELEEFGVPLWSGGQGERDPDCGAWPNTCNSRSDEWPPPNGDACLASDSCDYAIVTIVDDDRMPDAVAQSNASTGTSGSAPASFQSGRRASSGSASPRASSSRGSAPVLGEGEALAATGENGPRPGPGFELVGDRSSGPEERTASGAGGFGTAALAFVGVAGSALAVVGWRQRRRRW
jgi:hypothetical protein